MGTDGRANPLRRLSSGRIVRDSGREGRQNDARIPSTIMNELKSRLANLGLSEDMVDQVIVTVAEYVKSKIPASFHPMIDEVLAGKPFDMAAVMGSLGGWFSGR